MDTPGEILLAKPEPTNVKDKLSSKKNYLMMIMFYLNHS